MYAAFLVSFQASFESLMQPMLDTMAAIVVEALPVFGAICLIFIGIRVFRAFVEDDEPDYHEPGYHDMADYDEEYRRYYYD